MDRSDLRDYAQHVDSVLESDPRMSEAKTKLRLLQEFISTLGWDVPGAVEPEYSVRVGSRTHHVDYALVIGGEADPRVFVEAKPSGTDLTADHRDQLRSYMLTSNVGWGILTNGREYEFLWRRIDGDEVAVHTLAILSYSDLPDSYELVRAYTPNALQESDSKTIAERIHAYDSAATTLEQERERLVSEFVDEIVAITGEIITGEAEHRIECALDEIIERAHNRGGKGTKEPERQRSEFWRKVESATGIENHEGAVILPEGSASEAFVEFVQFLLNEGYITDEEIPIESGHKRYVIHTEPVDKEGDEMYSPKQVGNYYLESNYSRSGIKQWIAELGERFRDSE